MMALTLSPKEHPVSIALRKMTPVLIWGALRIPTTFSARVPFPAPGGPRKISFMNSSF
jgi:hypothetical protein